MAQNTATVEVEYNGETIEVPTTMRAGALTGYYGDVPDETAVEYVYEYNGELRAEGRIDDTTLALATMETRRSQGAAWNGWAVELINSKEGGTPPNILWERD